MSNKSGSISLSNYIKAFFLAVISSFAVVVSNGTQVADAEIKERLASPLAIKMWQVSSAFNELDYPVLFFVVMVFAALVYLIPRVRKENMKWGIPFSLIASLFILLCDSYNTVGSWDKLFGSTTALVTSGLRGLGIAVLAFFIYDLINRVSIEKVELASNGSQLKSFITLSLIMFALWIPYMIILAPGAMGADTKDQFAQALGDPEFSWTISTIAREPGDLLLNNHHPVAHTLLLGIFLKIGELFGSYFAGMELYCILQSLVLAATLTFAVIKLREYGMSKRLSSIVYVFFTICPLFPLWGMTTFKDTPFMIALLVMTILLYDAFKAPEKFKGVKYFFLLGVLFILMIVRNNGFYMVLALLPFAVIHFRKDKRFVLRIASVMLIPLLLYKVGFTGIAFSIAGVEEGSPREMLSVPFQQTARYILEYGDEITSEEEKAITTVIGGGEYTIQKIADIYNPVRSDPVKGIFNKNAQTEDLVNYFKTWASHLAKHPGVYIEAFLHLDYSWFDFHAKYDIIYYDGVTDEQIPIFLEGLDNPESLDGARSVVWSMVRGLSKIPLINCIFEFSFYTWLYVIAFLTMLMRKKHKELLACLPIFANYAICFVGPVAYMRYVIPMVACAPFVIFIAFSKDRNKDKEITELEDHEIWIK